MWAKNDALENLEHKYVEVSYRPFDIRNTLYTGKSGGLYARPLLDTMKNLLNKENLCFVSVRIGRNVEFHNYFVTNRITDKSVISSLDNANIFPLYIYSETNGQQTIDSNSRKPNPIEFPSSSFFGFDIDAKSIERANQNAVGMNLKNVSFSD